MPTKYEEAAQYGTGGITRPGDWQPVAQRNPLPIQPSWLQREAPEMTDRIRRDAVTNGGLRNPRG